jgi:hypothetical protein
LDPLTYCVTTPQESVSDSPVFHRLEVANAHTGESGADDLMTVRPETLEADFKTAAIGTLVAGQWFEKNANTSNVNQGEYPLLLVTGGVLHQVCQDQLKEAFGRLMWIATIPVICFTFNSQICISEYCYQSVLCSAKRVQYAGGTTANSAAYYSERGRRISDEVEPRRDRGRGLHALF